MDFPILDDATRLARLAPPAGPVEMVVDTDTYNEIDDQFAVVYSLLSPERLAVRALYAAPFHNERSAGPGDGMVKSYEEILRLLERMGRRADGLVFRGSDRWMAAPADPVASDAAGDLVARAMADRDGPLYVVAIGAITNVASALLIEPRLVERIVVVWLAGQPHYWHTAREFNLSQDLHASRVILQSGVPFVHVPCTHVAQLLRTTVGELTMDMGDAGSIGRFLFERFCAFRPNHFAAAKEIWDLAPVAWLVNPSWLRSTLVHTPVLTDQHTWSPAPFSPLMRVAMDCNRNAVFADVFTKLKEQARS
ncbi:MAG: nucleoside hydrolase [Planctomycetes bacterium]|nr:nucleoside hydrolase [Planctomycetota bacterium]